MKTDRIAWTVMAFLTVCSVGCTANLEAQKNQATAIRELGEAYLAEGKYTAAYQQLVKAEKIDPRDPYVHYALGTFYYKKGKYDQAIDEYKKSLDLKPELASVRNNLGIAYLAKEDWDTAIACFKELIDNYIYITPHYSLSNLGFAYYKKKEYKVSEKYYLEALNIEPKFIIALRGLGKTYLAMGKIHEAVAELKKAIALTPDIAELYLDLGDAYTVSGDFKKALQAYNKVVELAPNTPLAREAKEKGKKLY
ncbi:MAG: tetratricopeptide repeat protein [Pseudomonadota bacterium]